MASKLTPRQALQRAVDLAGSQVELARRIRAYAPQVKDRRCRERLKKIQQQHVQYWLEHELPPYAAIPIEKSVDAQVTRGELKPDIYPEEEPGEVVVA